MPCQSGIGFAINFLTYVDMIRAIILLSLCILFSGEIPKQQNRRCHIVKIKSMSLSPKEISIDPYDTVRWINETNNLHNIVAEDGSFKSSLLKRGETFEYVFKTKAKKYYCGPHKLFNKKGLVKVILD